MAVVNIKIGSTVVDIETFVDAEFVSRRRLACFGNVVLD